MSAGRLICTCSACGREAEMVPMPERRFLEPPGWIAINALYWPTGSGLEGHRSLRLRFCATCWADVVAETAEVLERVSFTYKPE